MSSDGLTRVGLIRHGETDWNAERRIQGQTDIALNAAGRRQAEAAAAFLQTAGASALISSDLSRAWATAQVIGTACGLTPQPAPAWRERRYGVFEGMTFGAARDSHPEWFEQLDARLPDFELPRGGESLRQLQARVVESLTRQVAAHTGKTLLIVTHGGALDIVNRFVRGLDLSVPRDFVIPNAGIHWVSVCKGRWQIDAWAQTEHLTLTLDEL